MEAIDTTTNKAKDKAGGDYKAGADYTGAEVIVGGDFNVKPKQPRPEGQRKSPRRTLEMRAALKDGEPIKTTGSNLYDYWIVSSKDIEDKHAKAWEQTRQDLCSDHAGITVERI